MSIYVQVVHATTQAAPKHPKVPRRTVVYVYYMYKWCGQMEVEQFGPAFSRLLAISTSFIAAESSLSKHCISSQPYTHLENPVSFVTQLLPVFLFTSFDGVVLGDTSIACLTLRSPGLCRNGCQCVHHTWTSSSVCRLFWMG